MKDNVVLVIPSLSNGGAERVIVELANDFSRRGYCIHVITWLDIPDFYELDSQVVRHRLNSVNGKFVVLDFIKTVWQLRKKLITLRPVGLLSFMTKANIISIIASRFLRFRVVISERNSPLRKTNLLISGFRRTIYRFADLLVVQTNIAYEFYSRIVKPERIRIIPNPIGIQFYTNRDSEIRNDNVILSVGRLIKSKGHIDLLRAFSALKGRGYKLLLIGDGPERENLESYVKENSLGEEVYLLGQVKNIVDYYKKASVFVFPSYSEGFPNALCEAMALGLACISYDCIAGPSDIIQDSFNGFLIEVGDIESLKNTIDRLITDSGLRLAISENASLIVNDYRIESVSKCYSEAIVGVSSDIKSFN